MYTLQELRNKVKRRIRQLRGTTGSSVETEDGNLFTDNAIDDAINAGRKQLMISVRNAELWGKTKWTIETVTDTQEYSLDLSVISINGVFYNTDSDGERTGDTVEAIDIKDEEGEEWVLYDPFDQPSETNPKYRLTNQGIRLIVSTDGTVPDGKYVRIEAITELSDLTDPSDESGISETLDEMVVNWAVYVLCMYVLPNVAQAALNVFNYQTLNINRRFK